MFKTLLKVAMVMAVAIGLSACDNVPNGSVGVKVERYGDNRGVQNEVLGPGRYLLGPNTDLYIYPTYKKTETWMAEGADAKGNKRDESISFQAKGGMVINGDFGVALRIDREQVPRVFAQYRASLDEISDTFLRNMVRDTLNKIAGDKTPEEILEDRDGFVAEANALLIKDAAAVGITVEKLSAINGFRWPATMVAAMNAKTTATQNAIRIENELRATEAENKKQVANAETNLKVAELEAKATEVKGRALQANPAYVQQLAIEKWDGKYPTVVGSSTLISLPAISK